MKKFKIFKIIFLISTFFLMQACNKDMDPNRPITSEDKRIKNIEEAELITSLVVQILCGEHLWKL